MRLLTWKISQILKSSRSDQTLVPDTLDSPQLVASKIKRREKNIDTKFERLSMDLSDTEMNVEKEMFVRVSTQISKEEEEQAARSFDKIMFDNFADQSQLQKKGLPLISLEILIMNHQRTNLR